MGADQVSLRVAGLWICLALFLLRVIAQIEVLLVRPDWLPPMEAWYSGLLPYPVLLPLQIVLLMAMSIVAMRETRLVLTNHRQPQRWHRAVRYFGYAYFAAMVLRLVVQAWRGPEDLLAAGAIPVVFHWVLALFVVLLGRREGSPLTAQDAMEAAARMHRETLHAQHERPLEPARPIAMDRARRSAGRSLPR